MNDKGISNLQLNSSRGGKEIDLTNPRSTRERRKLVNAKRSITLKHILVLLLILSTLLGVGLLFQHDTASATYEAEVGGFLYAWDGEKKTGGKPNPHDGNGVDFLTLSGSQEYPVLAPKDGVVVDYFDEYPETPQSTCGGYSRSLFVNYVVLGHGPKVNDEYDHYTLIYHFKKDSIPSFAPDQHVRLGEFIGVAGSTGNSDANHVHMEVSRKEPGLNETRSYYCNGASIPVAKHRNNVDSNTVSYGFEEQQNQWPVEGGAQETSVGDSYNWEGIQTNSCSPQTANVILYNHIDYGGECVVISDPGQLFNVPEWMHVSSVYLNPSWAQDHSLTVCTEPNLGGACVIFVSSIADLRMISGANDAIKSTHNQYVGPSWLLEFSIADHPPLETDIHVVVQDQGDFDAMRVCFSGENCQETAATELYYTWPVYLEESGDYTISVQYRRESHGGNWANAEKVEYAYHLVVDPAYTACGSGDGITLTSGSDCVLVTQTVRDLAPANWADRAETYASVTGDIEGWFYDSVDFQGAPKVLKSGQSGWIGGNLSSIEVKPLAPEPPPNPNEPFEIDGDTVHLWHFDEGSGSTLYDSAATFNGTIASGNSWTTGKFDGGLHFPNPTDGRAVTFGTMNVCPITFEAWVKTSSGYGNIAGQLGGGGNTGSNKWVLTINGGKPKLEIWSAGGSQATTGYKDMEDGVWHYLMWTYDCGTSAILYMDNELVGTLTTAAQWNGGATTLEIGAAEGIGKCNCDIDEVRISNVARIPQAPEPTPTPTPEPSSTPTLTPTPTNTPDPGLNNAVELLNAPVNLEGYDGSDEYHQYIDPYILSGRDMVRVTLDLNGLYALGGDASALAFSQGEWQYVGLADYVQNGLDGEQTVDIALADFMDLDPEQQVGDMHLRFWSSGYFSVDVTSVIVYTDGVSPTSTPTPTATATPTPTPTPTASGTELLSQPWQFDLYYGADEWYQEIPSNALVGKSVVKITYDLHGLYVLGGDASAVIFDQNGWQYISLSDYGQNGYDGVQTVTIPLEDFMNLDPEQEVGTLHGRFWCDCEAIVDITSIIVE